MIDHTKGVSKTDNLKKRAFHPVQKTFAEHVLNYELELSFSIMLLVFFGYLLGMPIANKCLFVSHQVGPDQYSKGSDDIYYVVFWIVAFTFIRAATMKYIYHPFARLMNVTPFPKRQRFAEQGFIFIYYVCFWSLGMYIMYSSPHWLNTDYYWIDYPHTTINFITKQYYLMQTAFWFQQLYTIHIEKRRKDHVAMVSHHFITLTLLVSSYYANFTRIGNAVLCCMDLSDIFLSFAKILKYLDRTQICDFMFGVFAISWPITRHICFGIIIWTTAVDPARFLDMKWEPELGKYFTPLTQKLYLALFLSLYAIMLYWFFMIVKVIYRVARGQGADDTRSDDEDEDSNTDKKANGKTSGKKYN